MLKQLVLVFLLFFSFRGEALVSGCLRAVRNAFATKRTFQLDDFKNELAMLRNEFPRHGISIQKRHKRFLELYNLGRFDTPEKLLAATAHFFDNHEFNLSELIDKNLDKILIQKRLDLLKEPLSKKGEIRLSNEVPKDEASYYDWLSQVMNIFHHAELRDIAMSVSTNPLASNGAFVTRYKAQVENKIQESENAYRSFIARISRVAPEFKNKFPEYVPEQGWFPYVVRSAYYTTLLRPPWTELSKRPLSSEDSGVRTNHQLYWPRWVVQNQARIGLVLGSTVGTLFGAYALTLDEEELRAIAMENAPEFAKMLFNLDKEKMSQEHNKYYDKFLKERKIEIQNRLSEMKKRSLSEDERNDKEKLENELRELSEDL
ncbi:MAG: hypothetical protein R3A80_09695 [Bdellovibrionota bacterium]